MADTDPVQSLLESAPISKGQKADLWDAYHAAGDPDALVKALQRMPAPQALKASLWDLKSKEAPAGAMPTMKDAPNLRAVGGDTINGRDPNAPQSLIDRLKASAIDVASHLAQPQSGLDLIGLVTGTSAPVAANAAARTGPVVESIGRGISTVANASKRASPYIAAADVVGHSGSLGGLAQGAAIEAAPYVADAAGRGVQAAGRFLQRTEPFIKIEAPAVSVERPTEAVIQAAKESAPAAAEATPKTIKPILNALEMKEYMRLTRAGKSHAEAMELIDFQRKLSPVTNKQVAIENDYIQAHGRRQQ